MNFRETIKCEPEIKEKEMKADGYIKYISSQGENFLDFIETLNNCIAIAEKYELIGKAKIKARIKDFESSDRNTEFKALDDCFGTEIITLTERDKEWIMLLTQLVLKIERNKAFNKPNGYRAYNQMISLKDNKEEYDFSNIIEIIKNTKIKEKVSDDPNDIKETYKYPELKSQLEENKNLNFNELENRAILEIIQELDAFRNKINFYKTSDYMPVIEMQIKTAEVAESAIRGNARHSKYKNNAEEVKEEQFEERMKKLYSQGYLKRGINVPIKVERNNGKIKLQNFEQTLIEMWPFLRETIVNDRIKNNNKSIENKEHIKDLVNVYPFLQKFSLRRGNASETDIAESITRIKLLLMNTETRNVEIEDLLKRRTVT